MQQCLRSHDAFDFGLRFAVFALGRFLPVAFLLRISASMYVLLGISCLATSGNTNPLCDVLIHCHRLLASPGLEETHCTSHPSCMPHIRTSNASKLSKRSDLREPCPQGLSALAVAVLVQRRHGGLAGDESVFC